VLLRADDGHPPIAIDVPADFHHVPLDPSTPDRTAAQLDVITDLRLVDAAQREAVSLYLEALAIRLRGSAVACAAFCAVRLEQHPSTATLTIALRPTTTADASLVALGAAETLRRTGAHDLVTIVTLGARPVVTASRRRPASVGLDVETAAALDELVFVVPVTGRGLAVMLTLTTPRADDVETYRRVMQDICRSVRTASPQLALG
jgi:hypothetical protein